MPMTSMPQLGKRWTRPWWRTPGLPCRDRCHLIWRGRRIRRTRDIAVKHSRVPSGRRDAGDGTYLTRNLLEGHTHEMLPDRLAGGRNAPGRERHAEGRGNQRRQVRPRPLTGEKPAAARTPQQLDAVYEMSSMPEAAVHQIPTVYFIDDSATMREVIRIAFRRENFKIIACADAATALAQFEQDPPDAVITDVSACRIRTATKSANS